MAKKRKRKTGNEQILSYPLPIREEGEKIRRTLMFAKAVGNYYLRELYHPEILDQLQHSDKQAYKELEPLARVSCGKGEIPSRINRGILEITGRTLRSINERRVLYEHLLAIGKDPEQWDYRSLIKVKDIYAKSQQVRNLAEQTQNYVNTHGCFPKDYMQLQGCPQLKKGIISYGPDDGQAIEITEKEDHLEVKLKVLGKEIEQGQRVVWEWVHVKIPLPEHLRGKERCQPDLRLCCIHGEWLPVLDYKIQVQYEAPSESDRFLTVDWGTRKLVTLYVFDREGNPISVPIFLHFDAIKAKQARILREIDNLKAKRDRRPKNSAKRKKYNQEIAKRWRKYRAIHKALAHFAANVIVLVAKIYDCGSIYVEWLKGLKSQNKSARTNWQINTTVRQKIFNRVAYKSKILGVKLEKPLPPGWTSRYCPKCGKMGYHAPSPDRMDEMISSGEWFVCPHCQYNADRDYVACQNLARKVVYGHCLKNQNKAVVYKKAASGLLFRQRKCSLCERLLRNFNGWLRHGKNGKDHERDLKMGRKPPKGMRPSAFLSNRYFFASLLN